MSPIKFCPNCEKECEFFEKKRGEMFTIRGVEIPVEITREACSLCGEILFNEKLDESLIAEAYSKYRERTGLLSPAEIRSIRDRYDLSQQAFATLLGMSQATINRYEGGGLQEASHDSAIRACENVEVMKDIFNRRGHLLTSRQQAKARAALDKFNALNGRSPRILDLEECWCVSSEVNAQTGFRRFSRARYGAVVRWFCRRLNSVALTKMNKLLFYSDFLHFKVAAVSLTGSAYRKVQYGPVPSYYSELRDILESDDLINIVGVQYSEECEGEDYQLGAKVADCDKELDETALKVLESVARQVGGLKASQITARSHSEVAFKNTEDKKLISYAEAKALSLSCDANHG